MDSRFGQALGTVREELHARADVAALLFFGSVQRGQGKPGSDLDLAAITLGAERWSECRWVHGVEVQLQFGPLRAWQRQVESFQTVVVNAFATGELLFDRTGEATELKLRAERSHADGPRALTPPDIDRERFSLTNQVRDLEELPEHCAEARMVAALMVVDALRAWCGFRRVWAHRKPAILLRTVRSEDASLAARVESFYGNGSPRDAVAIADSVLDTVGGRILEFATPPKPA